MLLVSIIFGTLISVSLAVEDDSRVCDNCTTLYQCPQAINLATRNRSRMTVEKLRNAIEKCSKKQICCSDFHVDQFEVEKVVEEIESHPNLSLLTNDCGKITANRLLGRRYPSQQEFPWLVLISCKVTVSGFNKFDCEGTLINSKYVLTTAHCIKDKHVNGVRVGDHNMRSKFDCSGQEDTRKCEIKYQDIAVAKKITHENYDHSRIPLNDIGLLRLKRSVDMSAKTVGVICLPIYRSLRDTNLDGQGTIVGWSIVEDETTSNSIFSTAVSILDSETCRHYFDRFQKNYSKIHAEQVLCVGEFRRNSCIEGEGAPFILAGEYNNTYKYIQYGIHSHGPVRCGDDVPGVFIDVRRFMKWILDSIEP